MSTADAAVTDDGIAIASPGYRPWSHRLLGWLQERWSYGPLILSILASALLGGFALWSTWANGTVASVQAGQLPSISVRAPVTLYVLVGYLPLALFLLVRWTMRHLTAIQKTFALSQPMPEFPRLAANLVGVGGVALAYGFFLHRSTDPLLLVQPARWALDFSVPLLGLIGLGWLNFRFVFLLIWAATAVSKTAYLLPSLDLLDRESVRPFAQQGVRASLLAIVSLSVSSNLWLDSNSPAAGTTVTLITLLAATALALFLPTWGIHCRLRAQKSSELSDIRSAIARYRSEPSPTSQASQQLVADLALERRIMEVGEWPFDAGSYGRVLLYVTLGLGSWVGAALVERALESIAA